MISWAKKEIGLAQLETSRTLLKAALFRVELDIQPESGAEAWKFFEELKQHKVLLGEAEKILKEERCKPKQWWSSIIVKIYLWSVEERFDF